MDISSTTLALIMMAGGLVVVADFFLKRMPLLGRVFDFILDIIAAILAIVIGVLGGMLYADELTIT